MLHTIPLSHRADAAAATAGRGTGVDGRAGALRVRPLAPSSSPSSSGFVSCSAEPRVEGTQLRWPWNGHHMCRRSIPACIYTWEFNSFAGVMCLYGNYPPVPHVHTGLCSPRDTLHCTASLEFSKGSCRVSVLVAMLPYHTTILLHVYTYYSICICVALLKSEEGTWRKTRNCAKCEAFQNINAPSLGLLGCMTFGVIQYKWPANTYTFNHREAEFTQRWSEYAFHAVFSTSCWIQYCTRHYYTAGW